MGQKFKEHLNLDDTDTACVQAGDTDAQPTQPTQPESENHAKVDDENETKHGTTSMVLAPEPPQREIDGGAGAQPPEARQHETDGDNDDKPELDDAEMNAIEFAVAEETASVEAEAQPAPAKEEVTDTAAENMNTAADPTAGGREVSQVNSNMNVEVDMDTSPTMKPELQEDECGGADGDDGHVGEPTDDMTEDEHSLIVQFFNDKALDLK
ncbi:unnamed protein product, partial [Durusdinium trenchii]